MGNLLRKKVHFLGVLHFRASLAKNDYKQYRLGTPHQSTQPGDRARGAERGLAAGEGRSVSRRRRSHNSAPQSRPIHGGERGTGQAQRDAQRTEAQNAARLAKAQEIYNDIQDFTTVGLGWSVNYQSIMVNIFFKILAIFSKVWPFFSKFFSVNLAFLFNELRV